MWKEGGGRERRTVCLCVSEYCDAGQAVGAPRAVSPPFAQAAGSGLRGGVDL